MRLLNIFLICYVIFFVIPACSYLAYKNHYENNMLKEVTYRYLHDSASDMSGRISDFIDMKEKDVVFLSGRDEVAAFFEKSAAALDNGSLQSAAEDMAAMFDIFLKDKKHYGIALASIDGSVLWRSEGNEHLVAIDEIVRHSLATVQYSAERSEVIVDSLESVHHHPDLYLSYPVRAADDEGNRVLGIFVLALGNEVFKDIVAGNSAFKGLDDIYIVNRQGVLIAHLLPHEEYSGLAHGRSTSEGISDCFRNYDNRELYESGESVKWALRFSEYENHLGIPVLGSHEQVMGYDWCVMAEVAADSVEVPFESAGMFGIGALVVFIILIVPVLLLDRHFVVRSKRSESRMVRIRAVFVILILIMILVLAGMISHDMYEPEDGVFKGGIYGQLEDISYMRAANIDDHLEKWKKDTIFLAGLESVKDLLRQPLSFDERAIRMDVDRKVHIVSKEIENYINAHPEKTLDDLMSSEEFRAIAVQPVGKDGYSAIYDPGSLVTYFHKDPGIVGMDMDSVRDIYPELLSIMDRVSERGDASDFYDWEDINGNFRRKYGRFMQVPAKTADGISLAVAITAYPEDYQVLDISSGQDDILKHLMESSGYHNTILISPEGKVIYMAEPMEGYGQSLEWPVNMHSGLAQNYFDTMTKGSVSFYGPFIRHYGEAYMKISVMVPVYDSGRLLGMVALLSDVRDIQAIMTEDISFWDTAEIYLINDEKYLVSPLKKKDLDMLVQVVDSENVEACLEHIRQDENDDYVKVSSIEGEYLNYAGETVIGTDAWIPDIQACFLFEVSAGEFSHVSWGKTMVRCAVIIAIITIMVIMIVIIGLRPDRWYVLEKRRQGR